jgi:hypothetical protein
MRKILFLLLVVLPAAIYAQQIQGIVKDDGGNFLNGATISLLKAKDSAVVKLAISKNGIYIFGSPAQGEYRVMITNVGFKTSYSQKFSFGTGDVTIPEMILVRSATGLSNVNVTAKKPMVEVRADRTVLNVEGTINAVGSNALELLRKSPGVLLDKDDNISLAGKTGVQVYIDNKPTPLSGQELGNYLKSLPSVQIESIELITNPSAKYDAAGNAGIINIRLVRNKSLGTNGTINAGWNIARTSKYNAGFSLNYRDKSVNIFSTYSYTYAPNQQHISLIRMIGDSLFDQQNTISDLRRSHNYKAGADFFINKKNTLGIMVNGLFADPESDSYGKTNISNTVSGLQNRILVSDNDNDLKRHNANVNLNYTYADPKGTSFSLNADRGSYDFNSNQYQRNYYYDPLGQNLQGTVIYHMISPAKIYINSLKGDYEQNFKKGKLAIGFKNAWIKTDNNFFRFDVNSTAETLDKERSNHFIYKENINAGYINFSKLNKKISYQFGLRIENTNANGVSDGLKWNGSSWTGSLTSFHRAYTDFFPSAGISFIRNPKKLWSLTYSRRIDRPAYQDLNPFEFKLDEYTFMKGNIYLRPQYTNSFGISHVYKMKLNLALNYSHVKDMFAQIFDTLDKSKAFVSKKNLATQDIVNFNLSYPYMYKTYTLFTNISANYSKYKADFGTGRKVDLNAIGFNLFVQNSLKFKKTWTAELSGFFNAPTVYQGSLKGKLMYSVDAGLSKQCLKGKATIKASLSDIFYSQRFRASTDFAGQHTAFAYRQESRMLKLNFSYRFGNNGVKQARQRTSGAEEETKRVQTGSGMIGN